jgi:hypothetical protein
MTVVIFLVISLIKLSINIAVFGSKPELGSSQNKYFGLFTMARAMATLFAFLKFLKVIFLCASVKLTLFKHSQHVLEFCIVVFGKHFKGKPTFSATVGVKQSTSLKYHTSSLKSRFHLI